mmetsp:Transcript_123024/g.292491  ORF Transcript_123024/g.292491 Transcript_123024/m.292491 type:complete len:214 (+) Transcript_123024:143-784(+)
MDSSCKMATVLSAQRVSMQTAPERPVAPIALQAPTSLMTGWSGGSTSPSTCASRALLVALPILMQHRLVWSAFLGSLQTTRALPNAQTAGPVQRQIQAPSNVILALQAMSQTRIGRHARLAPQERAARMATSAMTVTGARCLTQDPQAAPAVGRERMRIPPRMSALSAKVESTHMEGQQNVGPAGRGQRQAPVVESVMHVLLESIHFPRLVSA